MDMNPFQPQPQYGYFGSSPQGAMPNMGQTPNGGYFGSGGRGRWPPQQFMPPPGSGGGSFGMPRMPMWNMMQAPMMMAPGGDTQPTILRPSEDNPNHHPSRPPPLTIFVGSIGDDIRDDDLSTLLAAAGTVSKWTRNSDPITGKKSGFGIAEFESPEAVLTAVKFLDGAEIGKAPLKISAQERVRTFCESWWVEERRLLLAKRKAEEEEAGNTVNPAELVKKIEDEFNQRNKKNEERVQEVLSKIVQTQQERKMEPGQIEEDAKDEGGRRRSQSPGGRGPGKQKDAPPARHRREEGGKSAKKDERGGSTDIAADVGLSPDYRPDRRERDRRERHDMLLRDRGRAYRTMERTWLRREYEIADVLLRDHRHFVAQETDCPFSPLSLKTDIVTFLMRNVSEEKRNKQIKLLMGLDADGRWWWDGGEEIYQDREPSKRTLREREKRVEKLWMRDSEDEEERRKAQKQLEEWRATEIVRKEEERKLMEQRAEEEQLRAESEAKKRKAERGDEPGDESPRKRAKSEGEDAEMVSTQWEEQVVKSEKIGAITKEAKPVEVPPAEAVPRPASAFAGHEADEEKLCPRSHKPLQKLEIVLDRANRATKEREDRELKKRQHELIALVPREPHELFAFDIDWQLLLQHSVLEEKLRPWVDKKVVEFLGDSEASMTEFIMEKFGSCDTDPPQAADMIKELQEFLDEDAEVFIRKMWQVLIFQQLSITS